MIHVNTQLAKAEIRAILYPDENLEHKELLRQASEMAKAKFTQDICKYKCAINLATSKEEKFVHAIECIAYLTGDKLFRNMHVGKGTKYEQNNSNGQTDKRS